MSAGTAQHRIRKLLHPGEAAHWTALAAVGSTFPNGVALLRHLSAARDAEALRDTLAELRYALLLRGIGGDVTWEPDGAAGPDLAVAIDNITVAVEVARFRPMNPGPPLLGETLQVYGNPPRDIAKLIVKVSGKFRQIGDRRGMIALWNDDDALEESEARIAVRDLRGANRPPAHLAGVVYGSRWIGAQQLYWFPYGQEHDSVAETIGRRLERVIVSRALCSFIGPEETFHGPTTLLD